MAFLRAIVLAAAMAACCVADAHAVTLVVDTTTDAVDATPGDGVCDTGSGACALRAAIQESNALAGADDITLPAGTYSLTLAGAAEDLGASGDLDVHDTLTITGAGAASTIIDGGDSVRVVEAGVPFPTNPITTLTLASLTIRGGDAQSGDACNGIVALPGGDGVCANTVALTLTDAAVEENVEGILALGSLTVTRSVIALNGMGAETFVSTTLITDSTIHHNGFGLRLDPNAGATIRNSTISENGATGIDVSAFCEPPQIPCPTGGLSLQNVTIVGHTVQAIAGLVTVYPSGGTGPVPVDVRNSYLAGNANACAGELVSYGYNVIQPSLSCTVSGDPTGNVIVASAPALGPLGANGGPTPTHALPGGNPAINAGNPAVPGSGGTACLAADQRGVARPVGGRCDIGAFESSCGDGTLDAGEVCETGICCDAHCGADDGLCPACLACDAGTTCSEPAATCQAPTPTKGTLKLDGNADPAKRKVGWKWKGDAVASSSEFGSPATPGETGYELCLYAGGTAVRLLDAPAGCNSGLCWSPHPRGFQLKSDASAVGKVRVLLKNGPKTIAPDLLDVKTKGSAFDFPTLPLGVPVRVRLERTDTGACWDATYDVGISKNTPTKVRAKSN